MRLPAWLCLLGAVLCLALASSACEPKPATSILVVVDSDFAVSQRGAAGALRELEVSVLDRDGTEWQRSQPIALTEGASRSALFTLPLTFGIAPDQRDSRQAFRVVVTGRGMAADGGSVDLVERQAIVSFRPGTTLRLDMFLSTSCRDQLCRSDKTVSDDTCDYVTGSCVELKPIEDLPVADSSDALAGYTRPEPSAACAPGQRLCGDQCFDADDPQHCGSCDNDCSALPDVDPASAACSKGQCTFRCREHFAECGAGCVSLQTVEHCGDCANACSGEASTCAPDARGAYACSERCSSSECGALCVDFSRDHDHCGGCAIKCRGDQLCTNGQCACAGGSHECGGACANDRAVESCGMMCSACASPAGGSATCDGTSCGLACPTGSSLCEQSCVDLTKDDNHCGDCATRCQAGTRCAGGRCVCSGECAAGSTQPCGNAGTRSCSDQCSWGVCANQNTPNALVSNQSAPSEITVSAAGVFWATRGSIMKLDAGGQARAVAGSGLWPLHVAADDALVYWTELGSCNTSSGTSAQDGITHVFDPAANRETAIMRGQHSPRGVTTDGLNVYWANGGDFTCSVGANGMVYMPSGKNASISFSGKTLGVAMYLVTGDFLVGNMASDKTNLYFTNVFDGQLRMLKIADVFSAGTKSLTSLPTLGDATCCVQGVLADGSYVYWTHSSGRVQRALANGQEITTLAMGQSSPMYLAKDATNLYWGNSGDGSIGSVPLRGGPAVKIVGAQVSLGWAIAVDATYVYWTSSGTQANGYNDGAVYRTPK